jgi:hypothetical protein
VPAADKKSIELAGETKPERYAELLPQLAALVDAEWLGKVAELCAALAW